LALPPSKPTGGSDCRHRLNSKVTVEDRRSGLAAQRFDDPLFYKRVFDPEGQAFPLLESSVTLKPVADGVLRLHGMLRCANYNLPFLFPPQTLFRQQRLKKAYRKTTNNAGAECSA
jgi:hypothetical protein